MYINKETLETAQSKREVVRKIKAQNPGLLITNNPPDELLANYKWVPVQYTARPSGDVVAEGQPELVDGIWHQTWEVREYTAEELAERLEQAKDDAMQRINDGYAAEMQAILKDYPNAETLTWDKQEREARDYQAWIEAGEQGAAAPNTPYVSALAEGRSMPKVEIVARIIAKADAWIEASGIATGKRQGAEDRIKSATTLSEANAIDW
ncbi:hypothetical protein [Halomonas sp. WWR20]